MRIFVPRKDFTLRTNLTDCDLLKKMLKQDFPLCFFPGPFVVYVSCQCVVGMRVF